MCFEIFRSRPPRDNSADVARQQEQERQARILAGEGEIDSAFSQFDNPFFDRFTQSFLDYYNPQADEQFDDARQALRYRFARQGILNSTPAQQQFGDLIRTNSDLRDQISSNAIGAANDLRGQVDTTRQRLSEQNRAAADPSAAARNAASAVGSVSTAPTFSPLANAFAGVVDAGSNAILGRRQALPPGYQQLFTPGAALTGRSGRVVR